ncbi:ABC-F family ATP-binding cassette domain-containing protein [Bdellovibrio sp. 22V]|uniref:ABC-F family ATP-binding cassette domain-containing protein n=1 Tax=Bdellovibrio sp. 22V TaxID=3044166 RepID=UPI0025439E06|nr:ABC-F family ATP-binding cassette domain-containing protein [Bdellovibrio sp. 22V]WII72545.1 ABC-F family ATP-binding cassette domain-containing protein [Bdellovibrio sp. 22V]
MQNTYFQATGKSLTLEFPRGDILFSNISFTWNGPRCGLVGPNGVGKSTFAKILAGKVEATSGELKISHEVFYLSQSEERPALSVAEYLIELWESPATTPAQWGPLLESISLEASLQSLSGGEWTRVRIAHALIYSHGLLILDEPTNNLDVEARRHVTEFIKSYQSPLLVISHDRDLLNHVDCIWELSNQGLTSYGGNYSFYKEQKENEIALQEQAIDRARREKKKIEREYHEKLEMQEKRMRAGARKAEKGGIPKILLGGRKRRAQETQGRIHSNEEKRVEKSVAEFNEILSQAKISSVLGLELPQTGVPEGKLVFEVEELQITYPGRDPLWPEPLHFSMKGPRRKALAGKNGAGKSSFIKVLLNKVPAFLVVDGKVHRADIPWAYLDQEYSLLDMEKTVLENVFDTSAYDIVETRNRLARFQFFGDKVLQPVKTLSGGEKLKTALAKIFLAATPPQFLILDEPTNNLDLQSLEILEEALSAFEGALLVVSHDEVFLENIGIEEVCLLQS